MKGSGAIKMKERIHQYQRWPFFHFYLLVGGWFICCCLACKQTDFQPLAFFEVTTDAALVLKLETVQLTGATANIQQSIDAVEYGFIYSPLQEDLLIEQVDNQQVFSISATKNFSTSESFSFTLSAIPFAPLYYYRAYAKKEDRISYGIVKSFSFEIEVAISEKVEKDNDQIILEGILTGIEALGATLQEHGHVYSSTNALPAYQEASSITIPSMPPTINDDGSYFNRLEDLAFYTPYYARAYVLIDGRPQYSKVISFELEEGWKRTTLEQMGMPTDLRPIRGAFASVNPLEETAYVGYGCDDVCQFIVVGAFSELGTISPIVQTSQATYQTLNTTFPAYRANAVSAYIGGKLYFGLGDLLGDNQIFDDFWEYDPENDVFTELLPYPGGGRTGAVAFVVGTALYVGTGADNSGLPAMDFYKLTLPSTDAPLGKWDTIASLTANCLVDGFGRSEAVAFVLDGEGYVGTGETLGCMNQDIWKYLPTGEMGTWELVAELPTEMPGRFGASSFTIGQKAFISTGRDFDQAYKDLWEFCPINGFTPRQSLPANGRSDAVGFTINNRGYIGTGWEEVTGRTTPIYNDFWTYYPVLDNCQ